jgi:ABC-type multidrug transport system fused ATPase/permease subunit
MSFFSHPEWAWLYREGRPFAHYQLGSLTCILASSAAGLAQPLLVKWLIDDVLPNRRWGALAMVTGLFLATVVGRSVIAALGTLVNTLAVKRMTFGIRTRLVRHVQSLSAEFYARQPVGDLLQRLERDVSVVGEFASDGFPSMVRVVAGTLMAIVVMVYLDYRLASIVLLLLPIFGYVRYRYRTILRRGAESVREASGQQSSLLHEILSGAIQIQLLGAERRLARHYVRASLTTMRRELLQSRNELTYRSASNLIIGLGMALIIGYGGVRVMLGGLTIGGLVAFYGYVGSMFAPMSTAIGLFARVIRVHASVRRLIALEQAPSAVRDAVDAVPLGDTPRQLAFRDVSFAFRLKEPVLQHIDLRVDAGQRVALVGESGAGKSSLMKLIPRLHDPVDGCLELDGRDIRSLQLHSLRSAISFVPQEPVLFKGTLLANLRFACPTATREEIDHAGWIACLSDVVARLPQGWNTELGPMGSGLSGGEKQRVAIARALLQRRPILVLDESCSALDAATERLLLSRLLGWAEGRMVVLVSHRLAAARWADRVVVMDDGHVVEDGCHFALYREGTHYGSLWEYREAPATGSRS